MNGMTLGGNNEDWEDPATRFWIYPPSQGKHGWIKFGFGSGFPQGGMNDQGLFWDATAGPFKEMPYSESNKVLYRGPLMQKVIEECSSIQDALEVFDAYYCEDQYKAQYLLGDYTGHSMIVEGDSILHKSTYYQVLTNFCQSDPDLGGYPCWRYEKAIELLGQCELLTLHFAGEVLAHTHQEGRYPTQYSNIYDLKNQLVYLFYFHNYEEYLFIDLHKAMKQGASSRDIPPLFSQVSLIGPLHGDTLTGSSATIEWLGLYKSEYSIVCSENPDLSNPVLVATARPGEGMDNQASFPLILSMALPLLVLTFRKSRGLLLPIFLIIAMIIFNSCQREDEQKETEMPVEFSETLKDLLPGTRYYWKIVACADPSGTWNTETTIQNFFISDE